MSSPQAPNADLPQPDDELVPFYIFMLAFWPVSIVLGLIDFYLVPEYDLRLFVLLVGLLAGGVAIQVYRAKTTAEEAS